MIESLSSIEQLKQQAKRLRQAFDEKGQSLGHSAALEMIARQHGFRDWNTLHARLGNRPAGCPVAVGDRVEGAYLGQPFKGRVMSVQILGTPNRFRVTIEFDEAVDVVTWDSFSAFRKRVTSVIDGDGVSPQKLSSSQPHMVLLL